MTAREVIARLRREEWSERPGRGAHLVFRRNGRRVVVSQHSGDVPLGTLRVICRQAGWKFPPDRK